MRKTWLLLVLAFALLFCGCDLEIDKSDAKPQSEANPQTDPATNDTGYEDIECFSPSSYKSRYWGFADSDRVAVIELPAEWRYTKTDRGYTVTRDGNTVGELTNSNAVDSAGWTEVKTPNGTYIPNSVTVMIERAGKGSDTRYRYRIAYDLTDALFTEDITLVIDYAEVCDFTLRKCCSFTTMESTTKPNFGVIPEGKSISEILILGNSFINSSEIGWIYNDMVAANGKASFAYFQSRGYATVATYVSDTALMNQIRNGDFDAVFICGFYSSGELENLKLLKKACEVSDTRLVILPAHNENRSVIDSAVSANSDLLCLDWKAEIDALIKTGIDMWDFCVNDQHKHSKPLAGFVGAHMIYRAMYGELPKTDGIYAIDMNTVEETLGAYVNTGAVELIESTKIYYFDEPT